MGAPMPWKLGKNCGLPSGNPAVDPFARSIAIRKANIRGSADYKWISARLLVLHLRDAGPGAGRLRLSGGQGLRRRLTDDLPVHLREATQMTEAKVERDAGDAVVGRALG